MICKRTEKDLREDGFIKNGKRDGNQGWYNKHTGHYVFTEIKEPKQEVKKEIKETKQTRKLIDLPTIVFNLNDSLFSIIEEQALLIKKHKAGMYILLALIIALITYIILGIV